MIMYPKINLRLKLTTFITKFCFIVYVFFVFFGTSLPFQKGVEQRSVEDMTTSNPINQIVFGALLIVSLILLSMKRTQVLIIVKKEKYFTLFLFWCFITIFFSSFPDISLKRFILYFSTFTVPLMMLLYNKNSDESLQIFYHILRFYIIICIFSVFLIPGAKDRYGEWVGLAASKNHLAQTSLISFLIFSIHFKKSKRLISRIFDLILIIITLILLAGAKSSTATGALLIVLGLWFLTNIDKIFSPLGIGKTISTVTVIIMFMVLLVVVSLSLEFLAPIFNAAGEDMTFTGRVDLWVDIWAYTKTHLLFGSGFRAFWVIDSPNVTSLYVKYIWLPIQAHNGYLDIVNELGILGFVLFSSVILNYFIKIKKLYSNNNWKWFVISAIIINFTESNLISPKSTVGVMFIFSYLLLFSDQAFNKLDSSD